MKTSFLPQTNEIILRVSAYYIVFIEIISVFTDLYKCFLISCGLPDRTKLPWVSIFLKSAKAFKMCSSFIMTTTMKSIYQARTAPHEVYLHCHMGVLSKAAKILLQCNQQCTKVIIFCSNCVGIFFIIWEAQCTKVCSILVNSYLLYTYGTHR